MDVLNVNNISKSYGDVHAVKNVSFSAQKGRIYGILGPNGAGKTTTIRMIMNIILPDNGDISFFNQPMNENLKNQIGYLPEERGLYSKMTVVDMLVFLGELHGLSRKKVTNLAIDWLERMELQEWKDKKVEELSKGMQQKIQFIATIMHDPDLIILDEPFSGLDPINTQLIKDIILELKSREKAIMFSTHMMDAAEKICDDIMLINHGEKILDGEIHKIKQDQGLNAIQVEYAGDGNFIKSLPMIEKINDFGNYTEIQIKENHESRDLLKVLVEKIDIIRWQTKESSLHDIFINLVGRENHA
jgi:ABC-2 type transport system ATP-binding protein